MNKLLLSAAVLAAFVTAVHVIAGGKDVASPLLASSISEEPRLTLYAVWHMVSVLLGISAAALVRAAMPKHQAGMASAVRLLALLWGASGLVFLVVAATQAGEGLFLKLPQWVLLLPVSVLAWLGANNSFQRTPSGAAEFKR